MSTLYSRHGKTVEEMYLFHGTPNDERVPSICKTNFDFRRCGETTGHRHGQGAYFSEKMTHAHYYSKPDARGLRVLFIANVLVGLMAKGDSFMRYPPIWKDDIRCDTTVDNLTNPAIFAKYDSNEYYPAYLIEYSK